MEDRILSYLDALEAALVQHGDDIANGALMWARIDAGAPLVYGAFFVLIGAVAAYVGLFRLAFRAMRQRHALAAAYDIADAAYDKVHYSRRYGPDTEAPTDEERQTTKADKRNASQDIEANDLRRTLGFSCGGGGIAAGLLGAALLANIWRWVGIFSPELWLVHKAMSAVGA